MEGKNGSRIRDRGLIFTSEIHCAMPLRQCVFMTVLAIQKNVPLHFV